MALTGEVIGLVAAALAVLELSGHPRWTGAVIGFLWVR